MVWGYDQISTHRILIGADRVDLKTWFYMAADQTWEGATTTRHSDGPRTLIPRTGRTELMRSFFTCRVPAEYDRLSDSVRSLGTINSFKNAVDLMKTHNKLPARGY